MSYELNKIYYWNNSHRVKLNAIWYENDTLWGGITLLDHYAKQQQVAKLSDLTKLQRVRKRINLSLKLNKDNTTEVIFANVNVPEEEKANFLQMSFDIMVENEEV